MFRDRTDAGSRLAEHLTRLGVEADIVLGIPRGGLPVARPVADELDVPLDIVVASKIGAPGNPELAIGAIASDGAVWRNELLIDRLGVDDAYIERERRREAEYARKKIERYRSDRPAPDLQGKRVILVDDGVATGATAIACIRQLRREGADSVIVAVPVGSSESIADLQLEADDVIAVEAPRSFRAVGQFYQSFDQVSDAEATTYLE